MQPESRPGWAHGRAAAGAHRASREGGGKQPAEGISLVFPSLCFLLFLRQHLPACRAQLSVIRSPQCHPAPWDSWAPQTGTTGLFLCAGGPKVGQQLCHVLSVHIALGTTLLNGGSPSAGIPSHCPPHSYASGRGDSGQDHPMCWGLAAPSSATAGCRVLLCGPSCPAVPSQPATNITCQPATAHPSFHPCL